MFFFSYSWINSVMTVSLPYSYQSSPNAHFFWVFLEIIISCVIFLLPVIISVFLLSQWKCPHRPEHGFFLPCFPTVLWNNWPIWRTVINLFERQCHWGVPESPSFFSLLPTAVACHGLLIWVTWKLLSCSCSHSLYCVDLKLHYFFQIVSSTSLLTYTVSSHFND